MFHIKKYIRYSPVFLINIVIIYIFFSSFLSFSKNYEQRTRDKIRAVYKIFLKGKSLNNPIKINRLNTTLKRAGIRIVFVKKPRRQFGIPAYAFLQNKKILKNPYADIFQIKNKDTVIFIRDLTYKSQLRKSFLYFLLRLLLSIAVINFFIWNLLLSLRFLKIRKKFYFDLFGLNYFVRDTFDKILKEKDALYKKNRILENELQDYKIREIKQKKDFDIASFNKNIEYRLQRSEPTESLYATIMEGLCEYLGSLETALYLPITDEEYTLTFKYNYYGDPAIFSDKLYKSKLKFTSSDYFIIEDNLYFSLKTNNEISVGIICIRRKLDGSQFTLDDVLLTSNFAPKFVAVIEKINSVTDGLTKLYNNRYFHQQIDKLFNKTKKSKRGADTFSVIMTDIDHFKQFNDKYGHQVGDFVLRNISLIIRASLREKDMAFRYGGEEIIILLPDSDIDSGYLVAERLRLKVETTNFKTHLTDNILKVTISLGVSEYDKDMDSYEEIVEAADKALYQAKEGSPQKDIPGRNLAVKAANHTG